MDRNIYIEEYGNNITLECTVKSIPTFINIYWQKISGESTENFTADTGVKDETGVKAKLFIFEGVPSDSGLYRCCAMNIAGFGHSDFINLTIHGGRKQFVVLFVTIAISKSLKNLSLTLVAIWSVFGIMFWNHY